LDRTGVERIEITAPPISPESTKRWTIVPADGGRELRYEIIGAAEAIDGATSIRWRIWSASPALFMDRILLSIRFENPLPPDSLRVSTTSGAPRSSWSRFEDGRLGVVFENLPKGADAGLSLTVPSSTVRPPFLFVRWLKDGGAVAFMFGLPAATFLLMTLLYLLRGRDAEVGAPTHGDPLPPALMGLVIDEIADAREVVATWVDLARRGAIRFGPGQEIEADPGVRLASFEDRAVAALRNEPGALAATVSGIYDEATRAGLFRANPARERRLARGIGIVLALCGGVLLLPALQISAVPLLIVGLFLVPVILAALSLRDSGGMRGTVTAFAAASCVLAGFLVFWDEITGPELSLYAKFGIGLVASGACVLLFAPALPARTSLGAAWRMRARDLVALIEAIPPGGPEAQKQFETLLPYALAFRLKKRFIHRFAASVRAPAWWRDVPLEEAKGEFIAFLDDLTARAADAAGGEGGG
jgi:hypothetical protein